MHTPHPMLTPITARQVNDEFAQRVGVVTNRPTNAAARFFYGCFGLAILGAVMCWLCVISVGGIVNRHRISIGVALLAIACAVASVYFE